MKISTMTIAVFSMAFGVALGLLRSHLEATRCGKRIDAAVGLAVAHQKLELDAQREREISSLRSDKPSLCADYLALASAEQAQKCVDAIEDALRDRDALCKEAVIQAMEYVRSKECPR